MNKEFVYQVGNNKKVMLRCTANKISRFTWRKLILTDSLTTVAVDVLYLVFVTVMSVTG